MKDRRTFIREYAATFIAIMLGVAFATVVLVGNSSLQAGLLKAAAGPAVDHNYVVKTTDQDLPVDQLQAMTTATGVERVHYSQGRSIQAINGNEQVYTRLTAFSSNRALTLIEGKLPAKNGEFAISPSFTDKVGVSLGEKATLTVPIWNEERNEPEERTLEGKIVGYVKPKYIDEMGGFDPTLYGAPETVGSVEMNDEQGISIVFVNAPSLTPDDIKALLPQPDMVTVTTDEAYIEEQMNYIGGGIEIFAALGAFVVISLIVTTMVVRNTYAITLTRRRHTIGLSRCIGATRGQVFREAVRNALVLSSVASIVGIVVGVATALGFVLALGERFGHILPLSPSLSPVDIVIPLATGLAVAVIGAAGPAAAASRTSPLEALRPTPGPVNRTAASIVIGSIGVALFGTGTLMMFSSSTSGSIPIGILGGVLSFAGVVFGGSLIVPNAMRALGFLPAKIAGVPGTQAISNAVQAPGKAAATVMALLVGVTLVTMTMVGAATVTETAVATIGDNAPIDAAVTSGNKPISESTTRRIQNTEGVEKAALVRRGMLRISDGKAVVVLPGDDNNSTTREGDSSDATDIFNVIDDSYGEVSRSSKNASSLQPGTVVLPTHLAEPLKLKTGDTAQIVVGEATKALKIVVNNEADGAAYGRIEDFPQFSSPDMVSGVVLRIEPGAEREAVNAIQEITEAENLYIHGAAEQRAMIENYIRTVVLVVVGLLALSIIIAGIGIANTLTLSVLERKRETSLLRALGMTRAQMRGMYTLEALLFALIAVVIGAGLGILYGWLGIHTIVASDDLGGQADVVLTIPWAELGLMAICAIILGVVASLTPAAIAVRTQPAADLTAT